MGQNVSIKSQQKKDMQLPEISQKVHFCSYVWKVWPQPNLNITEDPGGAEDCRTRVSRWCSIAGWAVNHGGKHSQHLLTTTSPLGFMKNTSPICGMASFSMKIWAKFDFGITSPKLESNSCSIYALHTAVYRVYTTVYTLTYTAVL